MEFKTMKLRVTFDSNVWRIIGCNQKPRQGEKEEDIRLIKRRITDDRITPCIPETIFNIEAIENKNRADAMANYEASLSLEPSITKDSLLDIKMAVSPSNSVDKFYNKTSRDGLDLAFTKGFYVLRCVPRMGAMHDLSIPGSYFFPETAKEQSTRLAKSNAVDSAITERGCGFSQLKALIPNNRPTKEPWYRHLTACDNKTVAKAMAEWADGDAVAGHIAYQNDFFCTNDRGSSARPNSILSQENRDWLVEQYSTQIMNLHDLACQLA
jgi:hypothetical protein